MFTNVWLDRRCHFRCGDGLDKLRGEGQYSAGRKRGREILIFMQPFQSFACSTKAKKHPIKLPETKYTLLDAQSDQAPASPVRALDAEEPSIGEIFAPFSGTFSPRKTSSDRA
jgi:hypothetical protein